MKDKLEVGMYVRFKKGKITYVRKLLEVIHGFETFDVYRTDKEYFDYEEKDYFDIVYPDEVLKPSYDILDLIEVGDYVNGKKVSSIGRDAIYFENNYDYLVKHDNTGIKSILTHEQFEQYSYKIGE